MNWLLSPTNYDPNSFVNVCLSVYVNDLPLHVDSSTDMYADDCTMCETRETVEELNVKLNEDMVSVKKWCHDN